MLFSVFFTIPCEDSYYYRRVWIHGITAEQAEDFVHIAGISEPLLEDIGMMGFGSMPSFDESWKKIEHHDGRVEYEKDHEHHIYTLVAQQQTLQIVGGMALPTHP